MNNDLNTDLSYCLISGNTLRLPDPKEYKMIDYTNVRKALLNAGAKYNKNTFIFPNDAQPYIDRITGGEKVNIKKEFQFYATPAHIADIVIEYADIDLIKHHVLEPSAGQGALIQAIHRKWPNSIFKQVVAFELLDINRGILQKMQGVLLADHDFLTVPGGYNEQFDRIIANPPFSKNQDIDHIRKMYECLKPGGRIVTIASKHWQYAAGKKEKAFKQWLGDINAVVEDVEAGEFKESGTNIATCIIIIDK